MNSKWVFGGIIFFTLLVVGSITVAFQRQTKTTASIPQYMISDQQKPMAEINPTDTDFGEIKLSDVKTAQFVITNRGEKSLYLYDIKTSCGCTSAVFEIDGVKSPTFLMHDNPGWTGIIKSGKEAQVEVIYDAKVHPVDGAVERFVMMNSNDPTNKQLQLSIKANVSK